MNNFLRNIIRILVFIVALLVLYIVFLVGVVNKDSKDRNSNTEEALGGTTMTDATLLDTTATDGEEVASGLDASITDSTATDGDVVASGIDASIADTTATDSDVVATGTDGSVDDKALPKSASIDMELMLQYPELPTGCESVALTMLLKYYGFDLDKTTIAKDYLIYSTNFVEGYMGNPFTTGGAGIYSPGLTRTANKYLDAQGSDLNAKNVTDSTPEELYRYIANGTPVVIWNTVYFLQNQPTGLRVKWGEKTYVWDNCEHCMVLSGYDLEKNVVIVHDPVEGVIERDAEGFWERYENLGSMALIIR